jgi:hypothetical protein
VKKLDVLGNEFSLRRDVDQCFAAPLVGREDCRSQEFDNGGVVELHSHGDRPVILGPCVCAMGKEDGDGIRMTVLRGARYSDTVLVEVGACGEKVLDQLGFATISCVNKARAGWPSLQWASPVHIRR